MTVDQLSALYNRLRNAALGRGVTPNVSPELAERVGRAYEAWREFATGPASALADVAQMRPHVEAYNRLRAAVAKELDADKLPPKADTSSALDPFERAAESGKVVLGLVAIGIGLGLAGYLWGGRK